MIHAYFVARALKRVGIPDATIEWWKGVKVTPSGNFTVSIRLGPQTPLKILRDKTEFLAHALRAYQVEIEQITPRQVLLTVHKATVQPFPKYGQSVDAPLFPIEPTSVPIGIDPNGYSVDLTLFDEAGGQVIVMAGSPGTGKSSALSLIVCGLADTRAHIVWFDPKGSADASKHSDRVEVVVDPIDASKARSFLNNLLTLSRERASAVGQGLSIAVLRPIVVIVDEWATLGVSGEKKDRDVVQQQLRTLTALGRASRIAVILSTQRPTSENIDVTTRSLASTRLCFAVGDKHGSIAALGYSGAEELNPRTDRGTALLETGHGPQRIKIYKVPEDRSERLKRSKGLNSTIEEVASWDQVSFREQRTL
jgi:hypothetical protein